MTTITGSKSATVTLNLGSNEAYAAPVAAGISQFLMDRGLPSLIADPHSQPPAGTGVVVLSTGGGVGVGGDVPVFFTVAYRPNPPPSSAPGTSAAGVPVSVSGIDNQILLDNSNYVLRLDGGLLNLNGGSGTVITGDGSDTISATGGYDIRTGAGKNVVFASGYNTVSTSAILNDPTRDPTARDIIVSGNGNDTIALGGALDVVFGTGKGTDFVTGGTADALIVPGSQSLNFVGGMGRTTVFAGTGSDTVSLGGGGGLVFGGAAGNNRLSGGGSTQGSTLFGGGNGDVRAARGYAQTTLVANGNATLTGAISTADNIFYGLVGNASLQGGNGADTFVVGGSTVPGGVSDTVNGGPGQDLISILAGRTGSDITITSFTGAERVTLQGYAGGSAAEAARALATAKVGASTVLTLSDNTRVTFVGITNLTSSSFV